MKPTEKSVMGPKKPKIMTAWYIKQQQPKTTATTLMWGKRASKTNGSDAFKCESINNQVHHNANVRVNLIFLFVA